MADIDCSREGVEQAETVEVETEEGAEKPKEATGIAGAVPKIKAKARETIGKIK